MKDNIFNVNENVKLNFNCKGKQYLMSLNIVEGLVLLYEIKGEELSLTQTLFIEDVFKSYEVTATTVSKEVVKKKRKRKKK